jgi:thioredoxin-like negative regulator of GroEL
MTPIVDGIEQTYQDQIILKRVKADVGSGPATMNYYRIPGHPTLLVFNQNGQETMRLVGPQPIEVVAAELDQLLGQ